MSFLSHNEKIALFIEKIKYYLILADENKYKINAFDKAFKGVKNHDRLITSGLQAKNEIEGVGDSIKEEIQCFLETGTSPKLERLEALYPTQKNLLDKFTIYLNISVDIASVWIEKGYESIQEVLQMEDLPLIPFYCIKNEAYWNKNLKKENVDHCIENFMELIKNEFGTTSIADVVGDRRQSITFLVQKNKNLTLQKLLESLLVPGNACVFEKKKNFFSAMVNFEEDRDPILIFVYFYNENEYTFGYLFRGSSINFNIFMIYEADKKGYILTETSLKPKNGIEAKICTCEKDIFDALKLSYIPTKLRDTYTYKNYTPEKPKRERKPKDTTTEKKVEKKHPVKKITEKKPPKKKNSIEF